MSSDLPLWAHPDFPEFYCNDAVIMPLEQQLIQSCALLQQSRPIEMTEILKVEEVYYNSIIEGVELDRASIRSSLNLNLSKPSAHEKEEGASRLLNCIIESRHQPLTHDLICEMNVVALAGHSDPLIQEQSGQYVGDMLIVRGGRIDQTYVEDTGVPQEQVHAAMTQFIRWFNTRDRTRPFTNAVQGHLHFEKIHPFADGNGRVGRALMNMGLMQDLQLGVPLALSKAIHQSRQTYYDSFTLDTLDLTETLRALHFMLKSAVTETHKILQFTLLRQQCHTHSLNPRQLKAMEKLLTIMIQDTFKGKLTNVKYRKLVGNVTDKTAQRDLNELVAFGLLEKHGERKGTHYICKGMEL